jgi:hypothetical protein
MAELSPLRRRMTEDMSVRKLAATTQQSYLHHLKKFSRHFGHSPDRLGFAEVQNPMGSSHPNGGGPLFCCLACKIELCSAKH